MTFTMWSLGHFVFILSPFITLVLLQYFTKDKSQEEKRKIGIILSVIMIILLLSRNIEIFIRADLRFNHELLPLQVCHFANFILLYAFWKKSNVAFSFAFTLNLVAAMISIVFANGLENYDTIITARGIAYIFGHILIVSTTLWAFCNDFVFIKLKTYLRTVLAVEIMLVAALFVNNFIYLVSGKYSNYFYITKPEMGTPLETIYNLGQEYMYSYFKVNYLYAFILMLSFPLVMFMVYLTAKLFKKAE